MDPQLQALSVQLGEAAIRNTASAIADRITVSRARRDAAQTISELEDIVNELIADKAELVRISTAFESELVAQRISDDDIAYITESVVPVVEQVAAATGSDASAVVGPLKTLLSKETLKILQLLGVNLRRAVGEPLTDSRGVRFSQRRRETRNLRRG